MHSRKKNEYTSRQYTQGYTHILPKKKTYLRIAISSTFVPFESYVRPVHEHGDGSLLVGYVGYVRVRVRVRVRVSRRIHSLAMWSTAAAAAAAAATTGRGEGCEGAGCIRQ